MAHPGSSKAAGIRTRILARLVMALAAASAACGAYASENLRRCEDAAGHVTYSNEACPDGTSRERTVEARPAVEVPKDGLADKSAPGAKLGGIVPTGNAASRGPGSAETEQEIAQEKRKSLVARCDDLVRRIEYGQQDLLTAAPGERASVELGMRRLQEEHASLCAPPRPQ
jgi:hypothetical protein